MKILDIKVNGHFDVRRIIGPRDYIKTKLQFSEEGIQLPSVEDIPFDIRDCRILLSPVEIHVKHDAGVWIWRFKRGFPTDYASVPSFLRSSVDNDRPEIVPPAFVHDANFRYNFLSFKLSNTLFREMMKHFGASWWLRFKAWAAVSTPIGRVSYDFPIELDQPLVSFQWSDN